MALTRPPVVLAQTDSTPPTVERATIVPLALTLSGTLLVIFALAALAASATLRAR